MLASKAEHLDQEAVRLEKLLGEMDTAEESAARSVHELETEQERLSARTYELDAELRQIQNLLGQTALDLDRAENRITFNREQTAQIDARAARLVIETEVAERQVGDMTTRMTAHREAVAALREQTSSVEAALRETTEQSSASVLEQQQLEARITELRQIAGRLVEESAREQAESAQAEEAAARHSAAEEQRTAAMRAVEIECSGWPGKSQLPSRRFTLAEASAQELGATVRETQTRLVDLRREQQETGQKLERMREGLSAERARHASIEQILSERAYTADAVQKLFNVNGERGADTPGGAFRAVGLLADYAEVQEKYEGAIEQFLRDELEYVVVESFDQARAGIGLLRDEMGGRATFFVDSLNKLTAPRAGGRCFPARAGWRAGAAGSPGGIPRAAGPGCEIFSDEAAHSVRGGERRARRADGQRKSAQLFSHSRGHLLPRPYGFRWAARRSGPSRAEARIAPARGGSDAPRSRGERAAGGDDAPGTGHREQ